MQQTFSKGSTRGMKSQVKAVVEGKAKLRQVIWLKKCRARWKALSRFICTLRKE